MLLIHCPYCEEEWPELEFRHAGEAHIARSPDIMATSDEEFADYLYFRDNRRGVIFERWRHVHGCGRFFNAARHSVTDKFLATYKAGEPRPDISDPTDLTPRPYGAGARPATVAVEGVEPKAGSPEEVR